MDFRYHGSEKSTYPKFQIWISRYHGSEKSTYPKFQISWISDIMDQKNRPTQSFRYHGFQISWIRKSTYPKFQISWISDIMDHKNRPTQSFRYHGFQISWIIKMFDLPKVSGIMDQRLLFVFFSEFGSRFGSPRQHRRLTGPASKVSQRSPNNGDGIATESFLA